MDLKANLAKIMQEAQKMQNEMQKAQETIANMEISGKAGGVEIILNGRYQAKKVKINDNLLDDKELLEDLVAAAINSAVNTIEQTSKEKIANLTAGLDLPKDFGNFGDHD